MMQTSKKQIKKGFTLIELMLAVAFLGTLLLSIAMLTMRLVDMYTKGATMRAVNSVGSAIVDDMNSHITSSTVWTDDLVDGKDKTALEDAKKQYLRVHHYTVTDGSNTYKYADSGAFCTNSYTYVFNLQPAMLRYREEGDYKPERFTDGKPGYLSIRKNGSSEKPRPYALARISDPGCAQFKHLGLSQAEVQDQINKKLESAGKTTVPYISSEYFQGANNYFETGANDLTVLLDGTTSDEATDLQLYDFAVMSAAQSKATNQSLYDIAFVLGTTRGGINVLSANNYCQKNSNATEYTDYADNAISYCSVNRFEFVARQTGEKE